MITLFMSVGVSVERYFDWYVINFLISYFRPEEHLKSLTSEFLNFAQIPLFLFLPQNILSFWVDSADCIDVATNTIKHKTAHGEMVTTKDWLPKGRPIRSVRKDMRKEPWKRETEILEIFHEGKTDRCYFS